MIKQLREIDVIAPPNRRKCTRFFGRLSAKFVLYLLVAGGTVFYLNH